MWQLKLKRLCFFGDIDDEDAAGFLNDISEKEPENSFEIINWVF